MNPKFIPGHGAGNAKLMVIGEAPGEQEEYEGKPFVGKTGQLTRSMLQKAGIDPDECFFHNVVPYRPPANKINRLKEIGFTVDQFYPQLYQSIKDINPNCILALGNVPLKALTGKNGISKYRGSILFSQITGKKVVASIHPAYLLHNDSEDDQGGSFKYSTRAYMQLDFLRAVEESRNSEFNQPQRLIKIIKDSYSLYQFLEQYKDHKKFALDIETLKCIPSCIAIAPSPNVCASVQLINIPGSGYIIPYHDLAETHRLLCKFLESDREWIGQNFKFDQQKIESVLGIHMGEIHVDTMLMQAIVNPEFPKSLEFLTSIYTREPYYKDEGREFILGKDPIDRLFTYNAKDSCVTFEAYLGLLDDLNEYGLNDFYFKYYNKLHKFYLDLEAEGILVDQDEWKRLVDKYLNKRKENQVRLREIAGYDINVQSPKQVFLYLTRDLNLPILKSTNEEVLVAMLGNHCKTDKQKESIGLILDTRRIRKTIGTYLSALPDGDGRMRTSYRIAGTETGRSSTSKCDPPSRPLKGFGLPFQVLTKHGDIGSDVGRMLIADPGYSILECDLSQAEARVVALLSDDEETLDLFNHADIHTLTASWIFGCKAIRDADNVTEDKRFIGKTVRHAGNYGMGKRRLMMDTNATARKLGINVIISEKEAGNILNVFHSRTPKIKNIFQASVQYQLKANNQILFNAFGRRRQFFAQMGDPLFREAYAFIPSSSVKDHLSMAGLRIKERIPNIRFIVESHDAFKALVKDEDIESVSKVFKEEFEKPIDFSNCSIKRGSIVIPSEIKVGKNYKDLK